MPAYYNEIDPFAAEWLRQLIKSGHIADGEVDTRSIEDVTPSELFEFTQCHFFAGIGVWSYALRRAGWPDDRPVWTGSCPCQPFSAAGKGAGFADERHLWPAFHWLIEQCRPEVVFGEQVASKDGLNWLDLVQDDVENSGYAFGAVDTCAAGFGAPHIRQRLYWVADLHRQRHAQLQRVEFADVHIEGERERSLDGPERSGADRGVADADSEQYDGGWASGARRRIEYPDSGAIGCERPIPTNGHWREADWLCCRDGKWRPVEPGTFPMAHGSPARVGRLRGYGNAINAEQAQGFIEAYLG